MTVTHYGAAPLVLVRYRVRRAVGVHVAFELLCHIPVGPHAIVFDRGEMTGNVWLLEPEKGAK